MRFIEYLKLKFNKRLTYKQVTHLLLNQHGYIIQSGPFKGMKYLTESNGSVLWAKLVGTYECELIPVIEKIINNKYDTIIDVGSAEGYYAVGLAFRTGANVKAYDISTAAVQNVSRLAELNSVSHLVSVAGEFNPRLLTDHSNEKVLLICDIEGAEYELLNPMSNSELKTVDILVEVHDGEIDNEIHRTLVERFNPTHSIELIQYNKSHPIRQNALPNVASRKAVKIITEEGRKYGISWLFLTVNHQ